MDYFNKIPEVQLTCRLKEMKQLFLLIHGDKISNYDFSTEKEKENFQNKVKIFSSHFSEARRLKKNPEVIDLISD